MEIFTEFLELGEDVVLPHRVVPLDDVQTLGISAGASAPEILVEDVVNAIKAHRDVTLEEVAITREDVHFKLPKVLNAAE